MGRQAFETRMVFREMFFCKSSPVFFSTLSAGIESMEGQEMGSPRHVHNRRQRTRKGPESECVQTPCRLGWHMQGEKDELTSCRGTVQSGWQKPPVRRRAARKGKWPPRGTGIRQAPPIPALQPTVFRWQSKGLRQGNRQGW